MRFNMARLREILSKRQRAGAVALDVPRGRLEYRVELRSSSRTATPFVSRSLKRIAEQLVIWSCELKEDADVSGGHHALFVYARELSETQPQLISFYKYIPFSESWVHLSGIELEFDSYDPKALSENLREYERLYSEQEDDVSDPEDDPEVDDAPTTPGERRRAQPKGSAKPPEVDEKPKTKKPKLGRKKQPWSLPTTVMGASVERKR